jgi:hypothetical protein
MAYAPTHEKELSDRSHRRRMEGPQAPRSGRQQAGTTEYPQPARDPRCRLLRPKKRLPLAATTPRVPAVGNRLQLVQEMEHGRHLRAAQRRVARAAAQPPGQESSPERGHRRLPDDQEHRGGRRTERLQRPQEGSRQEAPHPRGHRRFAPQSPAVHSAKVPDQDGLRLLLESARIGLSRLRHLWLDAGYEGRGILGGLRR